MGLSSPGAADAAFVNEYALLPALLGGGVGPSLRVIPTREPKATLALAAPFVDQGVDTGPVILQRALELPDVGSAQEVLERLHPIEHELLPEAVRLIARGAVRIDPERPRRVIVER